jgi:ankyrin repeat protein
MNTVPNNKYFQTCSTGKADVVAAYLDDGVDPNARDRYQLTGLMWAGRKGRIDVAELLLKRGADLEAGDVRGRTALFHAVPYKRYEFVAFLAKLGANVNPIDMHGWTPLDAATSQRDRKMMALLEGLGALRQSTEAPSDAAATGESEQKRRKKEGIRKREKGKEEKGRSR